MPFIKKKPQVSVSAKGGAFYQKHHINLRFPRLAIQEARAKHLGRGLTHHDQFPHHSALELKLTDVTTNTDKYFKLSSSRWKNIAEKNSSGGVLSLS